MKFVIRQFSYWSFFFRSNWPLFRQTAGQTPETLNFLQYVVRKMQLRSKDFESNSNPHFFNYKLGCIHGRGRAGSFASGAD
jgi:hypothetical protein